MNSPKYPRTPHFSWSPGISNDDRVARDIPINISFIMTEKCDGSNTSLESSGCYARTHATLPQHPSFDAFKALHSTLKSKIPNNLQLFGEWLYAKHSIEYSKLPGYFLLFGIRDLDKSIWLSWEEVELWAEEIMVPTVPVLWKGEVASEEELKRIVNSFMIQSSCCGGIREGVVVRNAESFDDKTFANNVFKCVRANHVQTSEHWKNQVLVKNKLK